MGRIYTTGVSFTIFLAKQSSFSHIFRSNEATLVKIAGICIILLVHSYWGVMGPVPIYSGLIFQNQIVKRK